MAETDLSLVIDPGGTGDRPGINLRVYPSGDYPLEPDTDNNSLQRTSNRQLAIGGFDDLQNFTFQVELNPLDFQRLNGLINWSQQQKALRSDWEIVVYNLAQPYSEISKTRTRYKVPSIPLITETSQGSGYFLFTYWIALQGSLQFVSKVQRGEFMLCTLQFTEGTKLTQGME